MSLDSAGGGYSGSSAATSTNGNLSSGFGTGAKNINIGGNPNVAGLMSHPLLLVGGLCLAVFLWRRFK